MFETRMCFINFEAVQVREMGRSLLALHVGSFYINRCNNTDFQSFCVIPTSKEALKIFVKNGAISLLSVCKSLGDILSGLIWIEIVQHFFDSISSNNYVFHYRIRLILCHVLLKQAK